VEKNTKNLAGMVVMRRLTLPFILLIAFSIRVSLLPAAQRMEFNYIADSRMYADKAMSILEGKQRESVYHQGPLYPYVLSGICLVAGRQSMYPALFIQMLLGLGCIFLVYAIAMRISGSWKTAALAALLLALYQPMIFYEEMILMESLLAFLYCALVLTMLAAEKTNRKVMWFAAGLILGIAALGRGSILLFAVFFIVFKAVRTLTADSLKEKRAAFARMALFVAGTALSISPITIRNGIIGHDFVPLAANYGITFFEGNNRFAKGIYMDPPGLDLDQDFTGAKIAEHIAGRPLKPSEVSRFWMRESWNDIHQSPLHYICLFGLKTAYYWNRAEIPNAESYTFAKNYSPFYSLPLIGYPIAGIFGLIGIALALMQRKKNASVLLLFIAAHMVSTIMFFMAARYRISVVPFLLIFASSALVYAFDLFQKKIYKKLAIYGLGAAGVALFVFFPWKNSNDRVSLASTYNNLGMFFYANGNRNSAQRYYESALREYPGFWRSYNNLGNLYLAIGDKNKAVAWYLQGLKKGLPDDSCAMAIHMNLGVCCLKDGKIEEAKKHFATAFPYVSYSLKMRQIREELRF
jgi:4-amino-4-deoxy-L-arabinose transferase-like glycosyltransferase